MALEEGAKAPAFGLEDQTGATVKLADLKGKHVVLYFYPKDDTSGCTKEACGFRDEFAALRNAGAVVLGVSPDDATKHQKFVKKHELPFQLLVDPGQKVASAYEAWGEKSMYGRKYMGILRKTYLIGPDGKIKKIWPKVKPEGHAAEVLAAITS